MAMFKKEEEVMVDNYNETVETNEYGKAAEVAYITSGTKIVGDIIAEGHLVMEGKIDGNVSVDGNLVLRGSTTGEIVAGSIIANCYNVKSNLTVRENIIVNEDSEIDGDIDCQNVTVRGTVKGNVTASGNVFLKSTAVVEGNIKAPNLAMESGAKVKGKIDIA